MCRKTLTRRARRLGDRNEPRAHWPEGEYLVPSKILAGKKHQRKGEKEKQKLPKLAQLASLASPHCPRGKEQGGRRFSTLVRLSQGRRLGRLAQREPPYS